MNFCTTYKEMSTPSVRSYARFGAIKLLNAWDHLRYGFEPTPCVQFFYFHHMFADEEANARKLLAFLAKHYTFISYSEAINRVKNNQIDKAYLCFSSDDGIKNNLRAARVFSDFDIKCCFFINPSIIGENDFDKIKHFCKIRLNMPPVEFLNWHEVEQLLENGHEIGDHSWEHHNLATLSSNELREDLSKSKAYIEKRIGKVEHFAYPYGAFKFFYKEALEVVNSMGYASCASAVRGCHVPALTKPNMDKVAIHREVMVFNDRLKDSLFFLRRAYLQSTPTSVFWPWNE